MKVALSLLFLFALIVSAVASSGQGSHILITPAAPVFGQLVSFAWNGSGDDVSFSITRRANASTVPSQPVDTVVTSGYGVVLEDGIPMPLTLSMGPTSNWTAGGADCSVIADIFSTASAVEITSASSRTQALSSALEC